MSANPNRFDWREGPDSSSPLQKGNRVLESIARQEALRALLAFSDLREQIRNRRAPSGRAADRDLFETERFILDEVLQLICDRALAITQADGIVIALAEGLDLVCRAACGDLAVERGAHLSGESEFLRGSLESGCILRCDDCETDVRLELDIAPRRGARSTVLVPLRGRREQLGVLQAFSTTPRAFTDHDVRCFDLFAELVLSALKPEDQDRRIGWLSNVADEVLQAKSATAFAVGSDAASETDMSVETGLAPSFPSTTLVDLPRGNAADESSKILDDEPETPTESRQSQLVLPSFSLPGSSRPGLSVVLSLVAVAAVFSAVTWWYMQVHNAQAHGKTAGAKGADSKVADSKTVVSPRSITAPPAPPAEVLSLALSDDLLSDNPANGSKPASDAALAAGAENKGASRITGVRHWTSAVGSTVVIDMDDQVPYEVHRLASPERIYFDLHGTVLSPELDGKTMDVGDVSLTRVRIGQPATGVTRVVLDTRDGANFSVSMESSPYRLVVELRGSDRTLAAHPEEANHLAPNRTVPNQTSTLTAAASAPSKAAPMAALQPSLRPKTSDQPLPARTGKFRVVLDAGHGGWDLGTVGRQGLLEKDLVLDVTQRLGKLLQARLGSEVMFTRTADTYLSLDQRADVANQGQADLFVSIHANYSTSAAARGVETYYTNLFSAPGSREVEKHDDGTFSKLTPVSLSADELHEKIEESRHLASSVQRALYATLASNSPDIRNRGIKDAAFAVLTGTTMPSILTEISFVSSPADERNLRSATYRQQIAEALYQGIARYQQSSPHTKVAQLQTPTAGGR
jgi:N-acetylmuramoyl-L-alanine amidase